MKIVALLILVILTLTACSKTDDVSKDDFKNYSNVTLNLTNVSTEETVSYMPILNRSVKIASHYVSSFTEAKVNNEIIFNHLKTIYSRYDIIALQNVEDIDVVSRLAGPLDKKYVVSTKVGNTFEKINYAFLYDRTLILEKTYTYQSSNILYDPYVAIFKVGNYRFAVINIQTDAADAQEEIRELNLTVNDIYKLDNVNDVYILGNLWADCEFYTDGLYLQNYKWLTTADTTAANNECAFSRIIDTNPSNNLYVTSAVDSYDYLNFEYDSLKKIVSDEYLVWMEIKI